MTNILLLSIVLFVQGVVQRIQLKKPIIGKNRKRLKKEKNGKRSIEASTPKKETNAEGNNRRLLWVRNISVLLFYFDEDIIMKKAPYLLKLINEERKDLGYIGEIKPADKGRQ